MPGGTRRFSRAAARGTIAAVEPTTGGQSMPRTVTAGRAHSMSDDRAVAEQLHAVEHAGVGAELVGRVRRPRPCSGYVEAGDRGVAPLVAKRREDGDQGGQRIGRGPAEHARVHL